jgi:hypothetical protein
MHCKTRYHDAFCYVLPVTLPVFYCDARAPEIVFKQGHFYLEGHYLDSFIRFILINAFTTIIVVNPYFDLSTPTQLMIKAKQTGKTVVLVTRPPSGPYFKKLHEVLKDNGITLLYHKDLHARAHQRFSVYS